MTTVFRPTDVDLSEFDYNVALLAESTEDDEKGLETKRQTLIEGE